MPAPPADSEDGGSNPSLLERVSSSVRTAAAGFDHGLIVKTDGKVLAFGSELRDPRGSSPGLYLTPLLIKLPVRAVAAGVRHPPTSLVPSQGIKFSVFYIKTHLSALLSLSTSLEAVSEQCVACAEVWRGAHVVFRLINA